MDFQFCILGLENSFTYSALPHIVVVNLTNLKKQKIINLQF